MSKLVKTQIDEILTRGVDKIINREHLQKRLLSGDTLRLKLGIDPTGADLHIGHAVVLRKLRAFQDMGHEVTIVVGDFTSMIGDPSGHDKMRAPMTSGQVAENLKTFKKQALLILDPKHTTFRYQTEWYDEMHIREILKMASPFSMNRMLERDLYARRLAADEQLSEVEFFYPLFQAYDSVAIHADVEFGGTDQEFNLLQGRRLQKAYGQEPQDIFTTKLLVGLDGRKMSKTYENTVNLFDAPDQKYGKIMSLRDDLISQYFELATDAAPIKTKNPRDAKMRLAREIVTLYHGAAAAKKAEDAFVRTFQKHETPSEMKTIRVGRSKIPLVDLLIEANLASSKNDARRVIEQGGVKIDGKVVGKVDAIVALGDSGVTLQKGKRHFVRVRSS